MDTDRYGTAIHEAGHACAHVLLGVPMIAAVVLDSDTTVGKVYQLRRAGDAETRALIFRAGPAAETRVDPAWQESAGSSDRVYAEELLRQPGDTPATLARRVSACEAKAAELLEAHWPAVLAVARLLYDRGQVGAVEVRAAIAGQRERG